VQSNHTRQVAAVAAKLGLAARLVQENWVNWPDAVNDRVGNILLSRIMGADVRLVDKGLRHRHQDQLGAGAGRRPLGRRDAVRHPGRGLGLSPGRAGMDRPRRVLGIDASAKLSETRAQVEKIARNTAELLGLGRDLRDDEITVLPGWAGDFYGIPVQSTLDAIRLTGRLEGMIIDPVYEGKSIAGLIDLIRTGQIARDSTVLYAHLGGQPALNAYSALFR
jgi:1-aminocyclopropane-1-carboxylate deaminase